MQVAKVVVNWEKKKTPRERKEFQLVEGGYIKSKFGSFANYFEFKDKKEKEKKVI